MTVMTYNDEFAKELKGLLDKYNAYIKVHLGRVGLFSEELEVKEIVFYQQTDTYAQYLMHKAGSSRLDPEDIINE